MGGPRSAGNLFSEAVVVIDGGKFMAVNNRGRNGTPAKLKRRIEQIEGGRRNSLCVSSLRRSGRRYRQPHGLYAPATVTNKVCRNTWKPTAGAIFRVDDPHLSHAHFPSGSWRAPHLVFVPLALGLAAALAFMSCCRPDFFPLGRGGTLCHLGLPRTAGLGASTSSHWPVLPEAMIASQTTMRSPASRKVGAAGLPSARPCGKSRRPDARRNARSRW